MSRPLERHLPLFHLEYRSDPLKHLGIFHLECRCSFGRALRYISIGMLLYPRMMRGIFGRVSRYDGRLQSGTGGRFPVGGPKVGGADSAGMQQACAKIADADCANDRDTSTKRGEVDEKDDRPRMA